MARQRPKTERSTLYCIRAMYEVRKDSECGQLSEAILTALIQRLLLATFYSPTAHTPLIPHLLVVLLSKLIQAFSHLSTLWRVIHSSSSHTKSIMHSSSTSIIQRPACVQPLPVLCSVSAPLSSLHLDCATFRNTFQALPLQRT